MIEMKPAIQLVLLLISGQYSGFVRAFSRIYDTEDCLDVAIVGGGIGGTYTAWKLRNQGLKVGLFEKTDRIGGRAFSVFLPSAPNVPLDLGAMRYVPGAHPTLENIAKELGFKTKIFIPDQFKNIYYFRGQRLRDDDLLTDKLPYNLELGESRDIQILKWKLSQRVLNVSNPDHISDIEEFTTPDGIPIYQQGHLSLMENVWSTEAKAYLYATDTSTEFYESNLNAAHYIAAINPQNPPVETWTIEGGMNGVSQKLAEEFIAASPRHEVKLNRRVDSIVKVWRHANPVYDLTMYVTQTVEGSTRDLWARPKTVCAEKVILAAPQRALQNIAWNPLQHDPKVQQAFQSLKEVPAMKIFLVYPEAWWDKLGKNSAKSFLTDNPLTKGGEFGRFVNASGHENVVFLASYTHRKAAVDYFNGLRDYPSAFPFSDVQEAFSVSSRALDHVHDHLASIYGIKSSDIPQPLDGVMHIWSEIEDGGAWQVFYPGFMPKFVEKFMRRPSESDNVFIVSNSYSRVYSMWMEGSLRAADDILSEFLDIV